MRDPAILGASSTPGEWGHWRNPEWAQPVEGPCRSVAAGPVSRILSAGLLRRDGHSSGPRITARLKRPTRRLWRAEPARARANSRGSLPIWSCSVWGLPCPPHYCDGGALLPHLFTLTPALPPGRYVFCGTFRRMNPPKQSLYGAPSRTLSGTLLCGVRTFLPRHLTRRERPSGPAANSFIVTVVSRRSSAASPQPFQKPGPRISRIHTDQNPSVVAAIFASLFFFCLLDPRRSVKSRMLCRCLSQIRDRLRKALQFSLAA